MGKSRNFIIVSAVIVAFLSGTLVSGPQTQVAYGSDFPSVSDIANAAASKVKDILEPLFDLIQDKIDDDGFGLLAQVKDPKYGLERLANDTQDEDFGLEAQVKDPKYGLDRIANDTQDEDFGLEMIDDQVEFIGNKTLTQLSKQEVDITVKKSNNLIYLKTSESGKPVDVRFLSVNLIVGMKIAPLNVDQVIQKVPDSTGLYLLDVGKIGNVDSISVEVQHDESPVTHSKLSPKEIGGTPVFHYGSTLITPQGTGK